MKRLIFKTFLLLGVATAASLAASLAGSLASSSACAGAVAHASAPAGGPAADALAEGQPEAGPQAGSDSGIENGLEYRLQDIKNELLRCLVRTRVRGKIRLFQIENLCQSIEVTEDHARGTGWEARVQFYQGQDGRLATLALWGGRGELLLEQADLPGRGGPLEALVTALELVLPTNWRP
jgi:hypothetical protein